jgi:hypothetical protein
MRRAPVVLLLAVAGLALCAQACLAAPSPRLSPAAQTLSECVQTNHSLAVLMLIDESGSLRTTDPLNQRVDGVRAAVTGLADLSETPVRGRKPRVSVLFAGFYGLVRPDPGEGTGASAEWHDVEGSTVDALNAEAEQYAGLNVGKATDYATALSAAHRLLVERAAELTSDGGPPPCKALIWFTDGRYSIPTRVGASGQGLPKSVGYAPRLNLAEKGAGVKAVAAGKAFMCRPGGLMDSIDEDRIVRFTVALSTQLSPEDAAFLDAATTGAAGGRRCGSNLSDRTGEYLVADNGDRLFFVFGNLGGSSPPVSSREVCPRLACVRGATAFKTVPGLSSFLIRASSESGGAILELTGPDGDSARLRPGGPGRLSISGTDVTQRWVSPRAVEVQGDFTPQERAWVGRWSYAFVDPAPAPSGRGRPRGYSTVQLFSDLEPTLVGKPVVLRGVPTELRLGLSSGSSAGGVAAGPLARSASLTATISDPVTETTRSLPVRRSGSGKFVATVSVPSSSSASVVNLGLTANLTTPGGTPIAPQLRSFSLPVRLPPGQGYPTVRPAELQLPSVEGDGAAEGTIEIVGSPVADGCGWIGRPRVEGPAGAGRIATAVEPQPGSAAHCLTVAKRQRRKLTIRLSPAERATGTVSASVPVHLRSEITGEPRVTTVPVTFVLVSPPNIERRAALFAALVAIGALLPLALLYVLNRFAARFTAPQQLLVLAQDATLTGAGLEVAVEPTLSAFEPLAGSGVGRDVRQMKIDLAELRTVAARNPGDLFRGPYGVATAADGGRVRAGGPSVGRLRSWRKGAEHELPLSITGVWLFLPRDAETGAAGGQSSSSFDDDPWGDDAGVDPWGPGDEAEHQLSGRLILLVSRSSDAGLGQELLSDASLALRESDLLEREDPPAPEPAETPLPTQSGLLDEPESTSSNVDPWA